MQNTNPFDVIIDKLSQLQRTINNLPFKDQVTAPSHDPDRLIKLKEAGEIIGKPENTMRRYVHTRGLPATKIGKEYLMKYGDFLKWVDLIITEDQKSNSLDALLQNRKRYRKN